MTQPEAGVIHCGLAILENSKPEIKQHLTNSYRVLKLVQHIHIKKAASSAYIRERREPTRAKQSLPAHIQTIGSLQGSTVCISINKRVQIKQMQIGNAIAKGK